MSTSNPTEPGHQALDVDPAEIASDYPTESGAQLAEHSQAAVAKAQEDVTPDVDHRPGEHTDMPFSRASDYPAESGSELVEHSRHD